MKQLPILLLSIIITTCLHAQGVTKNGQVTSNSAAFVDKNGRIGSSVGLDKNGKVVVSADGGGGLVINHVVGAVAPVTKTVTYGTVVTGLSGESKTWITQNLGASNQATSATDATEASAGWYFQFNRKQGYKHDGTTRTPNTAWITSIDENSEWVAANDPCTIELGTGWRVPTSAEWTAVDATGNWNNYNDTYNSVLKLHVGGSLTITDGSIQNRSGVNGRGYWWSSTQHLTSSSNYFTIGSSSASAGSGNNKVNGFTIRCINDDLPSGFTVNHTAGTVAPVTQTVTYGTVVTGLSGASKTWITQNLGASTQATSATDANQASAGWYFQFNRKQGYKHDGTTRTPNSTWITSISENSDWVPANDPCTIELGTGWRIPTSTEWTAVKTNGNWTTYTDAFNSGLKIHAPGNYIHQTVAGTLTSLGIYAWAWSSNQNNTSQGIYLGMSTNISKVDYTTKAVGLTVRCIQDEVLTVNHIAGTVAPVTKTVTYGTVVTNLSGTSKTWITQNLGASNQATSATDATEASAGWYFQFNKKQGFKHDGIRTPATAWISSISESSDWITANDPCTIELGASWRIPTNAEWTAVNTNGGWTNYNSAFSSVLKLHTAGYIGSGLLMAVGVYGYFWSSGSYGSTNGRYYSFGATATAISNDAKVLGFSLRCIKD